MEQRENRRTPEEELITTGRAFAVLGCGRLGTALATGLAGRGWPLAAVFDLYREPAQRLVERAGGRIVDHPRRAAESAGLLLLTVPDDALSGLARTLAEGSNFQPGSVALHCSGCLDETVLEPLRDREVQVGTLHPMRAVPAGEASGEILRQARFGISGDPEARRAGQAVAEAFQGQVLDLQGVDRRRYHAACVLGSNLLVALLLEAGDLLEEELGSSEEGYRALLDLAEGALRALEAGIPAGITGPVARGDARTVALHLEALEPGRADLYRSLSARLLKACGSELPRGMHRRLEELL